MTNSRMSVGLLACVAAGFAGGAASSWAQAFINPDTPPPLARPPRGHLQQGDVPAQRFVLTDAKGNVYGVIGMNGDRPEIDLYGPDGKIVWQAPSRGGIRPVAAQ